GATVYYRLIASADYSGAPAALGYINSFKVETGGGYPGFDIEAGTDPGGAHAFTNPPIIIPAKCPTSALHKCTILDDWLTLPTAPYTVVAAAYSINGRKTPAAYRHLVSFPAGSSLYVTANVFPGVWDPTKSSGVLQLHLVSQDDTGAIVVQTQNVYVPTTNGQINA